VIRRPGTGHRLPAGLLGFYGIYMAGAVVCNTVYGKKVFWTPPPVIK
jgi:hypothetical protein